MTHKNITYNIKNKNIELDVNEEIDDDKLIIIGKQPLNNKISSTMTKLNLDSNNFKNVNEIIQCCKSLIYLSAKVN